MRALGEATPLLSGSPGVRGIASLATSAADERLPNSLLGEQVVIELAVEEREWKRY